MKKTYLTEIQITELVRIGNSILTSEDYSKLRFIGKKYNIELVHGKMANLQLWASAIRAKMFALPVNDDFRVAAEQNGKWNSQHTSGETILNFIKYIGVWDSEYVFLCNSKFDQLEQFTGDAFDKYGVDALRETNIFIKNSGDYYSHLSKKNILHCDTNALYLSAKLKDTLDSIFMDIPEAEKIIIGHTVLNYAKNYMDIDQFHNTLFAGQ